MERRRVAPRAQWRDRVHAQGLTFLTTSLPDGRELPYWYEEACYLLSEAEVEVLEAATQRLHAMSLEAARFLASGAMGDLGLPAGALVRVGESLAAGAPSLYGRFDLRFDGEGPPKLLEYNADTPTGLLEASVAQWYWLEDTHPEHDQWNSLHERLILAWQQLAPRLDEGPVYFAHHQDEPTGEEEMTVTYLRDTADQAGLSTASITVGDIGWDAVERDFVDLSGSPMRTVFKLYPWESMLVEDFGAHVDPVSSPGSTLWLEPLWKVLLSNKALLAALWHLYPGDELLLPAYLNDPGPLTQWVAKPLHGREGDNIRVHASGVEIEQPGEYGAEGWCYQQWCPLPEFDGNKAVLGCWVVDGLPAGLGVRESDGWVTDYRARFVPHMMTSVRPSASVQQAWLADAGADVQDTVVQDVLPGDSRPESAVSRPMLTLGGPLGLPSDVQDDTYCDRRRTP
ncbi:Glutathionylspermidine synthase [Austwickia chelonae]|uniref:Putative glutathionylspermidine synthase n=1 Tax=Austwickia chelonae NBRC 105200 TaxID=1184607 RepID=K6W5N3_9MICO|nr:glutathionylspermidine synthase family protein [Austwickia chelonae]GAB77132.1 putative glutathionylspermidine synthase [Austwickia chelonae NBRC 105200]SEW03461.1 Glutathionylspermidine synthase [Austwickia chelonae]